MTRVASRPLVWVCALALLAGCASEEPEGGDAVPQARFELLLPEKTHIRFRNALSEQPTPHRNDLMYEYFSNGGGVAIGDLNGDSLEDVYFTGNMTYNSLYLNKGDMVFEDVTEASGTAGRPNTWKTGVTMADVNGDGLLDLYVCYAGDLPFERRVDELFINQGTDANGVPQFKEQARDYGLAQPHSSNQAYFFDYDRDGDLDLFLVTHNVERTPQLSPEETRRELEKDDPISGNRFYINNGGRFEDVTAKVGIRSSALTYGLGAGIADFDKDGWMDIYVGNDYSPPDYLYMNNGDGTFSDEMGRQMGHTSNASMGIDASDINNDGYPDVVVLDMLAEDNRRQKTLTIPDDQDLFEAAVASGFHHQYMRNTLQLNNGNGSFSEVGQLAGVSNTDWSWAPLVADYNNDGRKDLFVTNGTLHDITDRDFLEYRTNYVISKQGKLTPQDVAHLMDVLPSSELSNYMFENQGDLRFTNVAPKWGLARGLKSTGAAYADLDNDGDLDLVTNNINDYAYIFENRLSDGLQDTNYLQVKLEGEEANTFGIGAKVTLYAGETMQYAEQMPAKGYLSTVSPLLHFGLGSQAQVDSLQILWPDGRQQTRTDVAANQRIVLRQSDAEGTAEPAPLQDAVLEEIASPIDFEHQMDERIDDFRRQPLMETPQSFSGPVLAKADVDGNGLADVYVGGGGGQASRLYLQQPNGQFALTEQPAFTADAKSHDTDAAFFDYDNDGSLDLYVGSGGYGNFAPNDAALQDRLYTGDGKGSFTKVPDALPEMRTSTGAVAVTDVNEDSWPDLFVGGRVIPGRYPEPPRSYILINSGQGRFEDRTSEVGPELARVGMVSDADWHDLNGDGREELVVVGQWMPILVFENHDGRLTDETERYFERRYTGLWNTVLIEDLNQDGIADLVAGNLGLNAQLKASAEQPAELYYADFRGDGGVHPVLNFYIQGVSYPYLTLDELRAHLPSVAARFPSYAAYAEAQIDDLFTSEELENARKLEVNALETSLFVGSPSGRFEQNALPREAQFAPVFTITPMDVNRDDHTDLILGGNANKARIRLGKHDANYGILLEGEGGASFEYIPQYASGLRLSGDVRSALRVEDRLLFGVNQGAIRAYQLKSSPFASASERESE